MMNFKIAVGVFVLAIATMAASAGDKKEDKTQTLTGCVQQGADGKGFVLLAQDGAKWELEGNDVKLADHVGHTVTVEGKPEHVKDSAKAAVATDPNKKSGELEVRSLTMVSDSCK